MFHVNTARVRADYRFNLSASCAPLVLAACVLWPAQVLAQSAPQPTQADTIVVTASPVAGSADRFATIVTQINRDEIVHSGGANLADALRGVPGVANTSFAAGASRPIIRGMDAFRVAVLEDGISSSDVSEVGPDHGVPIDPLSARDIEVVRGAATLRWGSQAIGGVVNAINDRVPLRMPGATLKGEASAAYDANGKGKQGSILLDGRLGQFAFHADAFGRRVGDFDTAEGTQDNSFVRGGGYSAGSSFFFGPEDVSRAGAGYVHYNATYGIPGDETYIEMRQDKAISSATLDVGAGPWQKLNFNGGYADYAHSEIDPATGDILSTFKNREWNGRLEALFGQVGVFSTSALGMQYTNREFSGEAEASDYLLPTLTEGAAAFAFAEAPLGSIGHLQAAVRAEHTRVSGTPASGSRMTVDFTPVSASLGALWDVTDSLKLGVSASSAARAPGQVELYARGPHDGPVTFETGDPSLKIERANSLEGTVRVREDGFEFEGAVWGARFNNYIFGDLTGNLCDETGDCSNPPGGELKQMFYRQREAHFWGVEARATYDIAETSAGRLHGVALADMVRAEFGGNGGNVPRIQPYRIGGGADWESDKFDAGFLLLYVGAQKRIPAGDVPTDSYWNLDAQAAWRPFGQAKGLELALVGHNLTDEAQRNAVSLNRDVVGMPGRNIRLVARQTF